MRSRVEHVPDDVVIDVIAEHWGLHTIELRYLPVGGGAYHWLAVDDAGGHWFVTCDDLDTKTWFGSDRDEVFSGLLAAYGTAMELHHAGLAFVAAPIPASDGAAAVRVDDRHTVAVLDYLDGTAGQWGQPPRRQDLDELVGMLAGLHRTEVTLATVPLRRFSVPGRDEFEGALEELHRPWDSGPMSEPARRELLQGRDLIRRMLVDFENHAARLDDLAGPLVVTHGEPHPGNLRRTSNGLRLIDWDTVAVARPERDLWMIGDHETISTYCALTGYSIDRSALVAYRLLWALTDLAAFTAQLRNEHAGDADDQLGVAALHSILVGGEPMPYGSA